MSMLSKKENYMRTLKGEAPEFLTWAPNFDWWLGCHRKYGTLPEKYKGMSRNDMVRDLEASLWARASTCQSHFDGVKVSEVDNGDTLITEYETPVGKLRTVHLKSADSVETRYLREHIVKTVEDLKALKYLIEATHYEPDYEPFIEMEKDVGDDGITLTSLPCVPYIQFAKTDAGYEKGIYMLYDHPEKVQEILDLYTEKFLEAARIVADSPAVVAATGDNMDQWTCPPNMFKQYAVPYYKEVSAILHQKGKLFEGHWCGRTDELLSLVPGTGLDIVEAVVTKPMAQQSMKEALEKVKGEVTLQGGVPSVLMTPEGGTADGLEKYVKDMLSEIWPRKGFVLGLADNLPATGDIERVRIVSDVVNALPRWERG